MINQIELKMNWGVPLTFPELSAGKVHLWRLELSEYIEQVPELEAFLSAEELSRARRFVRRSLYERFVIVRALLKIILSKYLNKSPQELILNYSENGKPFLNEHLEFNITHSESMAVFALTAGIPVGVDIEFKREIQGLEAISSRYLSQNENEYIWFGPKDQHLGNFYRVWVQKEALVKAVGGRLFEVLERDSRDKFTLLTKDITVHPFYLHEDYASALAVRAQAITIEGWHLPKAVSRSY